MLFSLPPIDGHYAASVRIIHPENVTTPWLAGLFVAGKGLEFSEVLRNQIPGQAGDALAILIIIS
jgi:hypothetical protein